MIIERKHMDKLTFALILDEISRERYENFEKLEANALRKQYVDEAIFRMSNAIATEYEEMLEDLRYLISLKEEKVRLNEEQARIVRENRTMDEIITMIDNMIS